MSKISQVLAASLVLLAGAASPRPTTDVSVSFVEYRVLKEIGQVRLTTGFVHDPELQKKMMGNLQSFDRDGIILIAGDSTRAFRRREVFGQHSVETTVSIQPPVGHGYRGGLATATVVVSVDGTKRIDCAYDEGAIELADVEILPVDGMISIDGSYNDKRVTGLVFLNGAATIDATWLEHHAK